MAPVYAMTRTNDIGIKKTKRKKKEKRKGGLYVCTYTRQCHGPPSPLYECVNLSWKILVQLDKLAWNKALYAQTHS